MVSLLLITTLLFPLDNQEFKVTFLGLPAAEVVLNVSDTLYNNEDGKSIHFKANSTGFIKYLFNVSNQYNTITSKNISTILSFRKNTTQPNIKNSLITSRINQQTIYNNSSIIIEKDYFNIFSLLYFLSENKILDIQNINIEREGLLYTGTIIPIKIFDNNQILYDLNLVKNKSNNNSIIKHTDIFTWALFKDQAKREILVDYNQNNIVECIFSNGRIKMIAKNIKYNN